MKNKIFFIFVLVLLSISVVFADTNTVDFQIYDGEMNCYQILGENLTKIVHLAISMLRIAGAIIVIVNMTLAILEAVKDPDKIKSAKNKSISMLIILAIIGLFPTIIKIIGNLLELDLSCF